MFKFAFLILKLVIVLAIVIVAFNYFAGTPEEKANSKEIVGKVKDLAGSVFNLLNSEKDKFREGKYDDAFGKISDALKLAKDNTSKLIDGGQQWYDTLNSLEQQRAYLQGEAQALQQTAGNNQQFRDMSGSQQSMTSQQLEAEIRRLTEETERVVNQMYGR